MFSVASGFAVLIHCGRSHEYAESKSGEWHGSGIKLFKSSFVHLKEWLEVEEAIAICNLVVVAGFTEALISVCMRQLHAEAKDGECGGCKEHKAKWPEHRKITVENEKEQARGHREEMESAS
jgi:hypothetical protein